MRGACRFRLIAFPRSLPPMPPARSLRHSIRQPAEPAGRGMMSNLVAKELLAVSEIQLSDRRFVANRHMVRVVLWMTGALLAFSAMAVSIRVLASTLSVMEILALRAGLGLIVMAVLAVLKPALRATINRRHLGLHLVRNTIHLGAQYLWALSLLLLPFATVFALEFTTPAWALLLAMPVLGERMTASRIGAVVLGLIGVLVILRPGLKTFHPAALLVLAAAFGLAITLITTKKLTRTDSSFAIIFWINLIQAPLALIASYPLFVSKLGLVADSGRRGDRRCRAHWALLYRQRVSRRRCQRRRAARFHAYSTHCGHRLVALWRDARCLRFHGCCLDHCRDRVEPAR